MHLFFLPIFAMLVAFEQAPMPKQDVIEEYIAYEVVPEKTELGLILEGQLGLVDVFEEKVQKEISLVLVPEPDMENPWEEAFQDEIEVGPQVHAKLTPSVEKEIEREIAASAINLDTGAVLQTVAANEEEFDPITPEVEDLFAFLNQPATTLADSPPSSKDLYETLPITVEEKQKIGRILSTMAENNVFKLLFEKKYLERLGREVNHVHPVRFIGTVFSDPRLVHCMFQIRRSGFKWDGFIDGFRERFMEEVRANNVDKYLPGLAKALNVSAEDLQAYAHYKDVEGLVLYLMEKSRRHY